MGVQDLEKVIIDNIFMKFDLEWEERELVGAEERYGIPERFFLIVISVLLTLFILKDVKNTEKQKNNMSNKPRFGNY